MSGEGSSAKTAVNMKELDGEVKEFNENDDNLAKLRLQHVFLFLIESIVDWVCIPDI